MSDALAALKEAEIVFGDAAPRDPPVELTAGSLTAELHGIELAFVRLGEREIVRRIYASVRDEIWDTVLPEVTDRQIEQSADGFVVTFSARNRAGAIDFDWAGRIEGSAAGTLRYVLDGVAAEAFRYCRIGFCVLHGPEEYAGRSYRASLDGGPASSGTLPVEIAPQWFRDGIYLPAVPAFTRLDVELDGGLGVRYEFEGERFEIEDQRNWTDASFKTYCTPAHLGFPFDAAHGQRFCQSVSVSSTAAPVAARRAPAEVVDVEIGGSLSHPMPAIGATFVAPPSAPSSRERAVLTALGLRHLRVDVHLDDPGAAELLAAASAAALSAGAELELALFTTAATAASAAPLLRGVLSAGAQIARILAFDADNEVTSPGVVEALRGVLQVEGVTAPLAGGTDLWFAEINRERLDTAALDALSFSVTPEVHAFDDVSLVETLPVQGEVARAARLLAHGKPIVISPVTLRPRNSAITVDSRQASLFGAAWTLGSLKYLAEAGASAVTFFETTGPRGIFETDAGSPRATGLPALPGVVYPLYHVIAAACARKDATLYQSTSADAGRIETLVAGDEAATHILIANLRDIPQRTRIGPIAGSVAHVRTLDAASARCAMAEPTAFSTVTPVARPLSQGRLELELAAHAVAFVEVARAEGA